jgi:hypothetical protein
MEAEFQRESGATVLLENVAGPLYAFANEAVNEWVQISPFGDFPHARGVQRMDRIAAETMARNFESERQQKAERFVGVPFFAGHPDVPQRAAEFTDQRAHGWVQQIEPREDGLWGRVEWGDTGRELLKNKHFKFLSPFWGVQPIGQVNGRPLFRPVELVSVGLTNEPNIPVRPLANSCETAAAPGTFDRARLFSLLHLDNDHATEAYAVERIKELLALDAQHQALENAREQLAVEAAQVRRRLEETEQRLAAEKRAFQVERGARIALVLDNAMRRGAVAPWEEPSWTVRFENDFAAASAELATLSPVMKTYSAVGSLEDRRGAFENSARRSAAIQSKVQEKQLSTGVDYSTAWNQVRAEHPALFENMKEPQLRL